MKKNKGNKIIIIDVQQDFSTLEHPPKELDDKKVQFEQMCIELEKKGVLLPIRSFPDL